MCAAVGWRFTAEMLGGASATSGGLGAVCGLGVWMVSHSLRLAVAVVHQ